jgi:low temperature requirement protein LtrA
VAEEESERSIARAVGPLELFFDLVFVFAVSQLSHHLLVRTSWRGAGETAVLLVAVFGVWAFTSFEATSRDVERKATQRTLLVVMFLGLVMNAAISSAFSANAWPFVVPYLLAQFLPTAATSMVVGPVELKRHYRRALVWLAAATPLWLAGALLASDLRLAVWAGAAAIDLAGTWLAHPLPGRTLQSRVIPFDGEHMIERLRLFLIIALGEAVLTTGTAIAAAPDQPLTVLAGLAGMAVVVTYWAAYFAGSDPAVAGHLRQTTDPLRAARLGLNGGYLMVAALVALAVGNELVIAHPDAGGSPTVSLLLFGSTIGYTAVQAWYLVLTTAQAVRSRWIACVALVAAGAVAVELPRLAALGLLLLITCALDWQLLRTQRGEPGGPLSAD